MYACWSRTVYGSKEIEMRPPLNRLDLLLVALLDRDLRGLDFDRDCDLRLTRRDNDRRERDRDRVRVRKRRILIKANFFYYRAEVY